MQHHFHRIRFDPEAVFGADQFFFCIRQVFPTFPAVDIVRVFGFAAEIELVIGCALERKAVYLKISLAVCKPLRVLSDRGAFFCDNKRMIPQRDVFAVACNGRSKRLACQSQRRFL